MKTTIKIITILGILALTFYLGFRSNKSESSNPHVKVVTDTVFFPKPYPEIQIIRDTLKPDRVTIYQEDSSRIKELELRILKDSLHYSFIIQGLQEEIEISENFLKLYPQNPKLVEMSLFRDSLNLSLLGINGQVYSEHYNLFYQDYNYRWSSGVMGYSKTKYRPQEPRLSHSLIFGLDFLHRKPFGEFQLDFRFNNDSFAFLRASEVLLFNEKPRLEVGLKFRIWRKR